MSSLPPPEPGPDYFRALIEKSSDVISIVDAEGVIRYESPSIQRVLGYRPEELVGRMAWELVHPEDLGALRESFAELQAGSAATPAHYRVRRKDGSWCAVESTGTNRLEDPAVRGFVVSSRDVTERVQAQAELHDSNERLRALIRAAPEAIVAMDVQGRVTLWNPAAEEIFGWSESEVLGGPLPYVPEESREEHRALRERALAGETLRKVELIRWRKDGTVIPIQVSTAPLHDTTGSVVGVMSVTVDVSDQRAARLELLRREAYFRALIENSSDVITVLTAEGVIRYQSPSSQRVLGCPPEELLGRAALDLVHPADRDDLVDALEHAALTPGLAREIRFRFRHGDGSWRTLEGSGSSLLHDPAVRGVVINARDVTERIESERELRRAMAAAESASRAKSDFLAAMSHELRTPLNSVIGFANVLRRRRGEQLRPEDEVYLERILANGQHLLGIINDILDLSRIEAGKLSPELGMVALDTLLDETLQVLLASVPRGVVLRTELPPQLAPFPADARKLKQILLNLVGNALKFTEAGSVTITVAADEATGRPLRVDVSDTGIGIPAERLDTVFDAFEQAETGTGRRYGGSGLGLTISASLAQLLGYRIEVRSRVGEGSTFSLLLDPAAS